MVLGSLIEGPAEWVPPVLWPGPTRPPSRRLRLRATPWTVLAGAAALAVLAGTGLTAVSLAHRPVGRTSAHPAHHVQAATPVPTLPPVIAPAAAAPVPFASQYGTVTDQPVTVATSTVASLPVYASPGAASPTQYLPQHNNLGAPLVMLAVASEGIWIETYLPERPNEATGWVPAGDVTLSLDPYAIVVSLGERLLTLYKAGAAVFSTPVAPGEPSSPTPQGYFYVAEVIRVTDSGSPYGPYALGTSAFSNTYYSFDGGPGQIAIHGTNEPWLIGGYASHGCVRLPNAAITTVATQVPAGTPVDIGP